MARHYSYRVDHDLGFAPHVERGLCTVCGCKKTTIERWATRGSWVVGIGGNGTGQPGKLIYAMMVEGTPSFDDFKKSKPRHASYLSSHGILPDAPVLVSKHFFYFGHKAQPLPAKLVHIVHSTQGCKRLSDQDVELLNKLVLSAFTPGSHGRPNNGVKDPCGGC